MVELDGGEGAFKRPGAVPFNWEIRPGIPKVRTKPHDGTSTLLQPPKKLSSLQLTKLPSSSPADSSFAPPPSLGPSPTIYCRCSSARAATSLISSATALCRLSLFKSLFRFKKNKTRGNVANTGLDSRKTLKSDIFYGSETTTFSPSKSSLLSSSFRMNMKRNESDLSSSEKKIILMMERERVNGLW
ncbi:unnamed protein product [Eruca vesicaria subsp. sativa]|uniref:Uncharacterized protein n=1 Tax=Eruca vesicaria subsp. sativa TaxID=29727 RepID=A0ABC8K390_ERUVS|nr:unnamed protein product [Eruca vesicaria subsp. sativa]